MSNNPEPDREPKPLRGCLLVLVGIVTMPIGLILWALAIRMLFELSKILI